MRAFLTLVNIILVNLLVYCKNTCSRIDLHSDYTHNALHMPKSTTACTLLLQKNNKF